MKNKVDELGKRLEIVRQKKAEKMQKNLVTKCSKLGYLCNNPTIKDDKLDISFEPIDDYDRVNIKVKYEDNNKPLFYIDILDMQIDSNEEFADYIQVLKKAQNLLEYLNKIDWTNCLESSDRVLLKNLTFFDHYNSRR